MTKRMRIDSFLQALLILLGVFLMVLFPEEGYAFILAILVLQLLYTGIRQLIYYIVLARYMVGGKLILCQALVELDLGIQAWYLQDVPKIYVMLYLVVLLLFSGMVDVLRALDARKREGASWRLKLLQGLFSVALSVLGLIFYRRGGVVVYIYCFNLLALAVSRLTDAFRRTSVVYIR